ncbi:Sulfur carrier protein ThiS adenylyltransferase [Planctomycetes bacterium CA13]|uniref:Sulfur carrier protein ThiS adenylyltransferase n=1 Tax=Novipirellula herctigrandis TaxID=2527986 RepID=A0A5C5ZA24_9BACT|nr:Sulfur carrier protein ThiS adenylyltransferase [Planctomycetes bacterium CA13]
MNPLALNEEEKAVYEWQMWIDGFGETGQQKLKGATALVSRCGGLGSPLSYHLASAGIGRLIIAHAGNVKPSDLNRQILMTHDWLGKPRVESARRRLLELNPRMDVVAIPENISDENACSLVSQADIVFDCAPLFPERFAMNRACVELRKPMIEAAMFDMEGQVTTIVPGETPCLACLYPKNPPQWKRQFPVLGAVSAMAASIAAVEGVKVITGLGKTLAGTLLYYDSRNMTFQRIPAVRRPDCPVCGTL